MSLILILAVLLDHWLGEPNKYHPLIFFGRIVNSVEKTFRLSGSSATAKKCRGFIALLILVAPITTLVYWLSQCALVNLIISPIILYFCIAANSLKQHAEDVFIALEANDLGLAKTRVGWIVSRQTEKMNAIDIRKATIESVLENGADAIFAPIFWFVIAGPAGAILYRLSNTLDAMWGYKNSRYLHFGWAAARFDDVLNWVPARLTALTYALLGKTKLALQCWKNQAHLLDSPNAGPVMTAGAGALNIQLGGAAWYHGKLKDKISFGSHQPADNQSINKANQLISSSLYLWIVILVLGEILA